MSEKPLRPKPLFYTYHAITRMQQRGFTEMDVKRILYTGDPAESTYQPKGGQHRYGRQLAMGKEKRIAQVFFADNPDRYDIITVQWLDE